MNKTWIPLRSAVQLPVRPKKLCRSRSEYQRSSMRNGIHSKLATGGGAEGVRRITRSRPFLRHELTDRRMTPTFILNLITFVPDHLLYSSAIQRSLCINNIGMIYFRILAKNIPADVWSSQWVAVVLVPGPLRYSCINITIILIPQRSERGQN